MAKITLDEIKANLAEYNWKLVSTTYKNLDSELEFECSEGHHVFASWKSIRTKKECPICAQNKFKDQKIVITPKKKGERRILALDQATRICGWAIYSNNILLNYGTFEVDDNEETARIHRIKEWLISMITNWSIDMVAFEGIQYQANTGMGVTTFETLARLQGVLMETSYTYNVPFKIIPVATWRHHCGVKGKARNDRKQSMRMLVKQWFDITIGDDCSDAIGIGKYAAEVVAPVPPKPIMQQWE